MGGGKGFKAAGHRRSRGLGCTHMLHSVLQAGDVGNGLIDCARAVMHEGRRGVRSMGPRQQLVPVELAAGPSQALRCACTWLRYVATRPSDATLLCCTHPTPS